jgi:hypothetical protein
MSIHEFGLSYRIETTAINAYVEHLNDRQQYSRSDSKATKKNKNHYNTN